MWWRELGLPACPTCRAKYLADHPDIAQAVEMRGDNQPVGKWHILGQAFRNVGDDLWSDCEEMERLCRVYGNLDHIHFLYGMLLHLLKEARRYLQGVFDQCQTWEADEEQTPDDAPLQRQPCDHLDADLLGEWIFEHEPILLKSWMGVSDLYSFWDWVNLEHPDTFQRFVEWFEEERIQ